MLRKNEMILHSARHSNAIPHDNSFIACLSYMGMDQLNNVNNIQIHGKQFETLLVNADEICFPSTFMKISLKLVLANSTRFNTKTHQQVAMRIDREIQENSHQNKKNKKT